MSGSHSILLAGTCLALAACGGGSSPALQAVDVPGTDGTPEATGDADPLDLPWQDGWTCRPGATKCMGSNFLECLDDGSDWALQTCSPGQVCTPAGCVQPGTDVADGDDATAVDAVEPPDANVPDDAPSPPDPGQDTTIPDTHVPDNPPPECKVGDTVTLPCGLNGNGKVVSTCVDGQWSAPGECVDPDACRNGEIQKAPCGSGTGQVVTECQQGQWVQTSSSCQKPGHWTCQDNACTPSYDASACGDGTCYLSQGESDQSCPADCDYSTVDGEGQPCDQAYQCMFYPWPAGGVGYWECSGLPWDRQCHAVHDATFCGTPGQDYCYRDAQYVETPASCPSDCPGPGDCGTAADCVLLPWPAP